MRQAVLPTGEVMHFPDETPDEHMHATVRQKLGLPPPEPQADPAMVAQQQTAAVMQGAQDAALRLTQSTAALHQQMGNVMMALQQAVEGISNANQLVVRSVTTLAQIGEQVARAGERNAIAADATNRRTEAAFAETRQTIQALSDKIDTVGAQIVKVLSADKVATKGKDGVFKVSIEP